MCAETYLNLTAILRAALRKLLKSIPVLTTNCVTTEIPETQPQATLNYIYNYVKRKEEVETGKCNSKTFLCAGI